MRRNQSEGIRPKSTGSVGFSSVLEEKMIGDPFHPYSNSPLVSGNLENFIQSLDSRPNPNSFAHTHMSYYKLSTPKVEGASWVKEQRARQIKGEVAMKDSLEVLPEMHSRATVHQKETVQKLNLLKKNRLGMVEYSNNEEEEKEKLRQNLERRQKKDIQYKFKNVAHKQRQIKTMQVIQTMVGRILDDKRKEKKVVKYITDFKKKKSDLMKPILLVGMQRRGDGSGLSPKNILKRQLTTDINSMRRSDKLIEEFGQFFKSIPLLSIDNTNPMRITQPTTQSPQKFNFLKNYDALANDEKVKKLRIRKVVRNNYVVTGVNNDTKNDDGDFFPTQTHTDRHTRFPEKRPTNGRAVDNIGKIFFITSYIKFDLKNK